MSTNRLTTADVVVTIIGGVGYVVRKPLGVSVQIVDYDVEQGGEEQLDRDAAGSPCFVQRASSCEKVDCFVGFKTQEDE